MNEGASSPFYTIHHLQIRINNIYYLIHCLGRPGRFDHINTLIFQADLLMAHLVTTWPTYLTYDAPQGRPIILRLLNCLLQSINDRYNK